MNYWWEYNDVATMRNTIKFIKKLKMELAYDLEIPLLGIYLKKIKTLIQKDLRVPMITTA